jgi:hypothetical protein
MIQWVVVRRKCGRFQSPPKLQRGTVEIQEEEVLKEAKAGHESDWHHLGEGRSDTQE